MGQLFLGFSAVFDVVGGRRLSEQKSSPDNEVFSEINSDLPSRLHLRFALNLPGWSEGEGGRGDPPVEPEPSLAADFAPTDSAEEPEKKRPE